MNIIYANIENKLTVYLQEKSNAVPESVREEIIRSLPSLSEDDKIMKLREKFSGDVEDGDILKDANFKEIFRNCTRLFDAIADMIRSERPKKEDVNLKDELAVVLRVIIILELHKQLCDMEYPTVKMPVC